MAFARPKLVPLIFFLAGFGLTAALGTWQVERLHWKEGVIARIAQAHGQPPMATLPQDEASLEAKKFYFVRLRGSWVPNVEFDLTPRYYGEEFGYWIISPLKLADGRTVLVNRGWVPAQKKDIAKRPQTRVSGPAELTGMIRTGNERSWFTPEERTGEEPLVRPRHRRDGRLRPPEERRARNGRSRRQAGRGAFAGAVGRQHQA